MLCLVSLARVPYALTSHSEHFLPHIAQSSAHNNFTLHVETGPVGVPLDNDVHETKIWSRLEGAAFREETVLQRNYEPRDARTLPQKRGVWRKTIGAKAIEIVCKTNH